MAPVSKPRWGATIWVDSIVEGFGGNGAITSYALALLGTPVRLMGMLGDDDAGNRIASTLSGVGVDMSHVGRCPRPTPLTVALVKKAFRIRPGSFQRIEGGFVYCKVIKRT